MHDPQRVAGALFSKQIISKMSLPGEAKRTLYSTQIMSEVLSQVELDPSSLYQIINAVDPEDSAHYGAFTDACNRLRQKVEMPIKSEFF